jgi:hypothetical protein
MYSPEAAAMRRCRAIKADGTQCRRYSMWRSAEGLCNVHAGVPINCRHHHVSGHAKYPPCTCKAYPWPHRPAGGRCSWPEPYTENNGDQS